MNTAVLDLLKRAPLVQCVGADFEAQTITFQLPPGMVVAAGRYGLIEHNAAQKAIALDKEACPPAIQALLQRADLGDRVAATERDKAFWKGYAQALKDLARGTGDTLAAKDAALLQSQQTQGDAA